MIWPIIVIAFQLFTAASASPLPTPSGTPITETNKNNIWYLANCVSGSMIAYYDDLVLSQHGEAPAKGNFYPVSGGSGQLLGGAVTWEAHQFFTTPPDPKRLNVSINDRVWAKDQARAEAGHGTDGSGNWQCYQDTQRILWTLGGATGMSGDLSNGNCTAQYFCLRLGRGLPPLKT
ncbi:uncharacterized protein BDZ99DRAFT_527592 [Mytilinidion resinicola]|uniref:Uncharacterized protein n=1 Tax=Mytilinidion resinicola TaxID=574789 RepID=A0A6A6Y133_9PEZI|nr:uncharacterized protein BDZ99DRAFT_527592 [Mytilinidion resinicola]KAF2802223.1 hypothetical protein BDZ99DRAFT_527592 [Mytilinidion resinicola]